MKLRIVALLSIGFALLIALPYILIPGPTAGTELIKVHLKPISISRTLYNEANWHKWWPKDKNGDSATLTDDGFSYTVDSHFYNAVGMSTVRGNMDWKSRIDILPLDGDSALIAWQYKSEASLNPFIRIREHTETVAFRRSISRIMSNMQDFMDSLRNIYGMDIRVEMAKDTTLISTKFSTSSYPSTQDIYAAIGQLRTYIRENQAKETNYPMFRTDRSVDHYESMVAIPVSRVLRSSGRFEFKRFVPWKVLTGEVHGGDSSIRQAHVQFNNFIQDYNLLQMANSFESLITDRSNEKDTTKWVTRLYTPIP